MMSILDRFCMGWWFNGEGGMSKRSKGWLSEEGEGAGPNRPMEGDG